MSSHFRWRASDDQIKKAYRFKVLRHHPDKRRAAGEEIREDDDYFTCITKVNKHRSTKRFRAFTIGLTDVQLIALL